MQIESDYKRHMGICLNQLGALLWFTANIRLPGGVFDCKVTISLFSLKNFNLEKYSWKNI